MVKWIKAYGGYLGTSETKKGVEPTKRFGELETSFDPEIPE